jgi:hypothetical protein
LTADAGVATLDRCRRSARTVTIVGTGRVAGPTANLLLDAGIDGRWHHVGVLVIAGRRQRRPSPPLHVRPAGSAR